MNIYQIYYTRKGRQGLDAGWQTVAKSAGMGSAILPYYEGIRGREISAHAQYRPNIQLPAQIYELENNMPYVFITQANYNVAGPDVRGNIFFHGLVIYIEDFFELCKTPEIICGLDEKIFVHSIDLENSNGMLPVLHELPVCHHYDFFNILKKYNLDEERYKNLLKAAYWKIAHPKKSFCIRVNAEAEKFEVYCRELLYVIYMGLPYEDRIHLTFSSFLNGEDKLFFSPQIDSENYMDLETGECSIHVAEENNTYIEQIIKWVFKEGNAETLFDGISDTIENIFGRNYEVINNAQMQVVYDSVTKNIAVEELSEKLDAALKLKKINSEKLENYIIWLLNEMEIHSLYPTRDQMADVIDYICGSNSSKLRDACCLPYVRLYCDLNSEEEYENLYSIMSRCVALYSKIIDVIKRERPEFLRGYIREFLYRKKINNLSTLVDNTKVVTEIFNDDAFTQDWCNEVELLFEREISQCVDNNGRFHIAQAYIHYVQEFQKENMPKDDSLLLLFAKVAWDRFDFKEYQYNMIPQYRAWGLEQAAEFNEKADILLNIVRWEEISIREFDITAFFEIFNSLKDRISLGDQDNILQDYKLAFASCNQQNWSPAAGLLLCYSISKKSLDINSWLNELFQKFRKRNDIFSGFYGEWEDFAQNRKLCKTLLDGFDEIIRKCQKEKRKELISEMERLRDFLWNHMPISLRDTATQLKKRDLFMLYKRLFAIAAFLLVGQLISKAAFTELPTARIVSMMIFVVITIILTIIAILFFYTEQGYRISEFSQITRNIFVRNICLLYGVAGTFCGVLWFCHTIEIFTVIAVSAMFLLLCRFGFYKR